MKGSPGGEQEECSFPSSVTLAIIDAVPPRKNAPPVALTAMPEMKSPFPVRYCLNASGERSSSAVVMSSGIPSDVYRLPLSRKRVRCQAAYWACEAVQMPITRIMMVSVFFIAI